MNNQESCKQPLLVSVDFAAAKTCNDGRSTGRLAIAL